ncbi:MAG: CPBP family intramembrane glutamic endopeptidase [Pseudomonadota bacterium]|nr:CPBP family intramembrane glutamic endopeptidase [Pseudomonadota bacterium]
MRAPEFEAYIRPARLYPQIWRLLLGILLIGFIYFAFFALMLVVLYPVIGAEGYFGFLEKLRAPSEPAPTLFALLSFVGMALGVVLAAAACHFRGPGSLFGPWPDVRRDFLVSVGALIPVYAIVTAGSWLFSAPELNLPLGLWLRCLPLALMLLLVQISAEEMLFRGYLQQQLAARFTARWIWMGLPAVLFASLHWNPEAGLNAWMIIAVTLAFALIAADLTEQTGSLGAAMGLHFINNSVSLLFLSTQGTITGLSLYVTPYTVSDAGPVPLDMVLNLLMMVLIWRLLRFVLLR